MAANESERGRARIDFPETIRENPPNPRGWVTLQLTATYWYNGFFYSTAVSKFVDGFRIQGFSRARLEPRIRVAKEPGICCKKGKPMTRPGTFYHIIVYSVLLLCVSGCGIFTSGTWEDDDGNWERAFASTKPDGVIILHSRYWRSSHWSYEFAYFFEIECNDEFKEQLIAQNNLNKLGDEYVERLKNETFDEAPEWFAPKDAAEYEVWILEASNFRLFVDKETCTLFLTDYTI